MRKSKVHFLGMSREVNLKNDEDKKSPTPEKTESEKDSTDAEIGEKPDKWQYWTAGSFAFVMLIIGLPLWWVTTTVERVPLPNEMTTLKSFLDENIKITINVYLKGFSTPADIKSDDGDDYPINYNFRQTTDKEMGFIYKSKNIYEVDRKFCMDSEIDNDIHLYYVGRADLLQEHGPRIILGNCRSAYYISNSAKINPTILSNFIQKFSRKEKKSEEQAKLSLSLSAGYDILLTLLVPEPEKMDCKWDIQTGIKKYMDPILEKLNVFAEFNIRSQILYYVNLNINPQFNKETKNFEIPHDQLPLVINPVESKLTSFVSQNPALNFLIYVSPCEEFPLRVLDNTGNPLVSNSFLVPRWGGIQIYNAPCDQNSSDVHEVNVNSTMSIILAQLRSLIGLQQTSESQAILNLRGSAIRDWEVDIIVRERLIALLSTSANTLESLGNLLGKITNIVVTQEVASQVYESVKSLKSSYEESKIGNLKTAQSFAINAFKSSEIAFHHPKNLAQLYFPDDQKYAIYIPLYLPVGIPVIFSLYNIFKKVFKKK